MAITSQGTSIRISEDGTTFTDIGCVESFDLSGEDRATIDTTCLSSTAKEYIFGLRDNGTLSSNVRFNPQDAGWKLVEASYSSDDAYHFQIEFADSAGVSGTLYDFTGNVVNTSTSGAVDAVVSGSFSVKLTGDVTVTDPA
jgi:hypothetical protein